MTEQSGGWRNTLILLFLAIAIIILMPIESAAADPDPGIGTDDYLCTPRFQLRNARRCPEAGPAGRLAELARLGIYPEKPLPAHKIDSALGIIPYSYLRLGKGGADKYGSVQDAVNKKNAIGRIKPGFLFASWIDRYEKNGVVVYMIASGVYIRGDNASRITTPTFRGLVFSRTPDRAFAWVLCGAFTSAAPGHNQPMTTHWVNRYNVVQIYDVTKVGDWNWYMVGPDEWIEQRLLAIVDPDPVRPFHVGDNRWISINLHEQTLAAYDDGRLVYATLVSSGSPGWWTKPGVFYVYEKLESDTMAGSFEADRSDYYYLEDVPWTLYYDEGRAIHGSYWHNKFGYATSHGCVNLSPADGHWIYDWAWEGTWVYVWDPTGETPTDEEAYGGGV